MMPRLCSNRLLQAGALLAPVLIVQAAASVLGTGPAAAPAATVAQPVHIDAVLAPRAAPAPTPAQRQCLNYLASLPPAAAIRSPMVHEHRPEPPAQAQGQPDPEPEADAPEPAISVPHLRLTALLSNREGGLAAIDGRIRRVGDEVAPAWRLSKIDPAGERIFITSDDGHTAVIALRRDRGP